MQAPEGQVEHSWFRGAHGMRFALELGAVILAKIVVLVLLYLFAFAQPRVPTSPAAMRDHLVEPAQGAQR